MINEGFFSIEKLPTDYTELYMAFSNQFKQESGRHHAMHADFNVVGCKLAEMWKDQRYGKVHKRTLEDWNHNAKHLKQRQSEIGN
ncbi:MAG: hypothetical protein LBG88_02880 [Christensenellaceae bacterium]|jgi:uncharacterized protein YukE|nr:hypothetical protein [Christensenellaceae bacterium]